MSQVGNRSNNSGSEQPRHSILSQPAEEEEEEAVDLDARINSFDDYPLKANSGRLAQCGFFHLPEKNFRCRIKCVRCHNVLDTWRHGDEPSSQRFHKDGCEFVKDSASQGSGKSIPQQTGARAYTSRNEEQTKPFEVLPTEAMHHSLHPQTTIRTQFLEAYVQEQTPSVIVPPRKAMSVPARFSQGPEITQLSRAHLIQDTGTSITEHTLERYESSSHSSTSHNLYGPGPEHRSSSATPTGVNPAASFENLSSISFVPSYQPESETETQNYDTRSQYENSLDLDNFLHGLDMKNGEHRLHTFQQFWDENSSFKNIRLLATCGYFCIGRGDAVQCFHCGVTISNWDRDDNPRQRHEQVNPNCRFLRDGGCGDIPLPITRNLNRVALNRSLSSSSYYSSGYPSRVTSYQDPSYQTSHLSLPQRRQSLSPSPHPLEPRTSRGRGRERMIHHHGTSSPRQLSHSPGYSGSSTHSGHQSPSLQSYHSSHSNSPRRESGPISQPSHSPSSHNVPSYHGPVSQPPGLSRVESGPFPETQTRSQPPYSHQSGSVSQIRSSSSPHSRPPPPRQESYSYPRSHVESGSQTWHPSTGQETGMPTQRRYGDPHIHPQHPPPPDPEQNSRMQRYPCRTPLYPGMQLIERRVASFRPSFRRYTRIRATNQEIAQAGFYYTGVADRVKCFYCGQGLERFEENDNPWEEHAKYHPQCEYLLQQKGPQWVQEIVARNPGSVPTPINELRSVESTGYIPPPPVETEQEQYQRYCQIFNEGMQSEPAVQARLAGFSEEQIRTAQWDNVWNYGACYQTSEALITVLEDAHAPQADSPPQSIQATARRPRQHRPQENQAAYRPEPMQQDGNRINGTGIYIGGRPMDQFMNDIFDTPFFRGELTMNLPRTTVRERTTHIRPGVRIERSRTEEIIHNGATYVSRVPHQNAGPSHAQNSSTPAATSTVPPPQPSPIGASEIPRQPRANSRESSSASGSAMETSSQERLNTLERERACKVCLTDESNTLFEPCRHICCCSECAERVQTCPICRSVINRKIRSYRS